MGRDIYDYLRSNVTKLYYIKHNIRFHQFFFFLIFVDFRCHFLFIIMIFDFRKNFNFNILSVSNILKNQYGDPLSHKINITRI